MWKHSIHLIHLLVVLALVAAGPAHADFDPLKDPAIIGWWAFDEDAGTVAADSSPNGNNAALNGGAEWVPGLYGTAISFNGSDAYVGTDQSLLSDLGQFTIACWLAGDPSGASRTGLIGQNDCVEYGFISSNTIQIWTPGGGSLDVSWPYDDLDWHHIVAVGDGSSLVVYIDGEEAGTGGGATNSYGTSTFPVNIGGGGVYDGSGNWFEGLMDDVAIFSRALTPAEILAIMEGITAMELASEPVPADEATDIPRDDDLSWTPGKFAATHDVYFGTSFDDVNDADRANPMDVWASQDQADTTYDPGRLEFGQTYYWRIDEVNAAPDNTIFKGDVWSFTVEPFTYPIEGVVATTNAVSEPESEPAKMVDGSGLDAADQHSVDSADMWLGTPDGADPIVVEFTFDQVYKLHEMIVWNYNVIFEPMLGFGLKDVTVEYSENGADWTVLGDVVFAQAAANATYTANTSVEFNGAAVQYVKLIVNSGYGPLGKFGLSEVRFLYIPVQARYPQPTDGETGVSVATELTWRSGREAASHEVALGTDPNALPLAGTVDTASYAPGALDLETTYYWQVTEVNEVEAIAAWTGRLWSFVTQEFLVVDDFESYTDDEGSRIYETWEDGWVNDTGATVGYLEAPFAETVIVHSGGQAMPLFYDNAGLATAEADLALSQDWTASGIQSLSLYFHGAQDNTGDLYLKIDDTKIPYDGDAGDISKAQWQPWNIDLSTVGANLSNVGKLTIGIEGAGVTGVLYIDDIRLYPRVPEFITPVEPDPEALLLYYALDEGSGAVATDGSGNGNNGTIEGSPAWISGISGTALGFDGSRDYVTTGSSLLNDLTGFTIACWIKGDLSLASSSGLVGQNDCIEFGVSASNNIHIWTNASGPLNLTWRYDADADWHHLAAVGDGQLVTIYLDGKPAVSGGTPIDDTYGSSTFPVNIGGGGIFGATDNWLTGDIDEIYIYQRALSPAEVAGLAGRTEPIAVAF